MRKMLCHWWCHIKKKKIGLSLGNWLLSCENYKEHPQIILFTCVWRKIFLLWCLIPKLTKVNILKSEHRLIKKFSLINVFERILISCVFLTLILYVSSQPWIISLSVKLI